MINPKVKSTIVNKRLLIFIAVFLLLIAIAFLKPVVDDLCRVYDEAACLSRLVCKAEYENVEAARLDYIYLTPQMPIAGPVYTRCVPKWSINIK